MTVCGRTRRGIGALIVAALWIAVWALEGAMAASARQADWMAARKTAGSPAMAQMAGAFRVVAANVLWLKVDAYHHEWEERGLDWAENKDLLPLLRAVTYLDPHFVEAYGVYGTMLVNQDKVPQGLAVLQEGVRNNRNRYELYETLGLVYARRLNRPQEARDCFARALALAADDFDRQRLSRTLRLLRVSGA